MSGVGGSPAASTGGGVAVNFEDSQMPRRDALPSRRARFLAFAGIVVAGVCGALAGYAFGDLQGSSSGVSALWALGGGVGAAIGVAIVATLILRAMDEWEQQR